MIATAVFSTILLVVLTAVTTIGRMYYKGLTSSQTQETARSILDRVSQEIQFSGKDNLPVIGTSGSVNLLCIGNTRFFYVINKLPTPTSRALWTDSVPGCVTSANATSIASTVNMNTALPTPGGQEVMPDGMRLVAFNASQVVAGKNDLWSVRVKVVFGADDLIDATNPATGAVVSQSANPAWTTCKKAQLGTQFCAISDLSTTVLKRVP
jgi:hypothetical protein